MTANFYLKCNICGKVTHLKYQLGFVERHPIRFKCVCGVTIKCFRNGVELDCDNSEQMREDDLENSKLKPAQIVFSSSEFLSLPPKALDVKTNSALDYFMPGPFIMEAGCLKFEEFSRDIRIVLSYKYGKAEYVYNCNELYQNGNLELVGELARNKLGLDDEHFPKQNKADWVRLMNYVNQIQFMRNDDRDRLISTENAYAKAFREHRDQMIGLALFFQRLGKLEYYRNKTYELAKNVNDKLEFLIPSISIDYYKEGKDEALKNDKIVTTVSFEDVKTLYEDLYEHILKTVILAIGIDNILVRGDFTCIRKNSDIHKKAKDLEEISRITKYGWILKYIEESAESEPLQGLLCNLLNQSIRNSIGHFDYEEVAGSYGQTIRFLNPVKPGVSFEVSLKEICYDIWQMYKCLAIIYELIYRFETLCLAVGGITVSGYRDVVTNVDLKRKYYIRPIHIYPNAPCPCRSGLKYKKCCGKIHKF